MTKVNLEILNMLKIFRFGVGKKFGSKGLNGVEFEDLIQTLDLIILEAVQDYDETKHPSPFTHIINKASNGIWNYYRKEMNYFDEMKNEILYDDISRYDEQAQISPIEDLIVDEIIIKDALQKIRPKQRVVLEMFYFQGKNTYDIAEELGINQSNVFRRLERGLNSMKQIMDKN